MKKMGGGQYNEYYGIKILFLFFSKFYYFCCFISIFEVNLTHKYLNLNLKHFLFKINEFLHI